MKNYLRLTLFAVVAMMCGTAMAETTVTWSAAEGGSLTAPVAVDDNITLTWTESSGDQSPKIVSNYVYFYNGNQVKINTTGNYKLTKIVFSFADDKTSLQILNGGGSYTQGTWTGETDAVTFRAAKQTGVRKITSIEVTYKAEGEVVEQKADLTMTAFTINFGDGETTALDLVGYYREEYLEKEAEFNTDENGNMIDPFLTGAGPSEYVLEGHTHPNLHVFFSGPDRESGKARAASDPICIFVCDPIRKEMLGAIGRNMEPTEVIVYSKAPAKQIVEKPIHASPFVPLTPEPRLPQRTETKETVAQTPQNKKEAQSIEDLIGALYARLDNTAGYEVRWKRRRKLGGAIVTKIKIVRQRRRYKIKRRNEYELP